MECKSCGAQIDDNSSQCPYCQAAVTPTAAVRPATYVANSPASPPNGQTGSAPSKMAAGICGILLGAFGVHKFILGYHVAGIIMLCITVLSGFMLAFIPGVLGLIEGIIYLTKSDQEFVDTYVIKRRTWL